MRTRIKFICLSILVVQAATAQSPEQGIADEAPIRTLAGTKGQMSHGGWGSLDLAGTRMLDQDAFLIGGRGGWLINHRFTVGIAGYGKVTAATNADYDAYKNALDDRPDGTGCFHVGYAGLLLEPIIKYRSPVHVSLPVIIGAGGAGFGFHRDTVGEAPEVQDDGRRVRRNGEREAQAFFVLEPGVQLEVNLLPMVRFGLGASYRYTSRLELPATAEDALRGINVGMSIKVGSF